MSFSTAARGPSRLAWVVPMLALVATAFPCLGAGQGSAVAIEKEIVTDKTRELPEWYINDGGVRAQVQKLLTREAKLAQIEESVAAHLSAAPEQLGEDMGWVEWMLGGFVAEAGKDLGELVGFVEAEAPATMNLFWFGSRVSRAIDLTARKRHALEAEYVENLLGTKKDPDDDKEKGKTFFSSSDQDRVLKTLRKRIDAVRSLRQEAVDSFLLTRRAVDRTALPTATFERASDLWLSDTYTLQRLEREKKAAESRKRELQADVESKWALVQHAKKLIETCEDKNRKAGLQTKLERLEKKHAEAKEAMDAVKRKIEQKTEAIEKEKLGIDSRPGKPREEPWTKQKIDQLGAAISSGYAELAIRRRIMKRATREAEHLYSMADKLSAFRRMVHTGERRRAILEGEGKYSGKKLRATYIDQGLVSLARRERRDEDSFMGQVDYSLRMVEAVKKFGEGAIKKKIDRLQVSMDLLANPPEDAADASQRALAELRKDLRFFCDEVGHLKAVGGGAFTTFVENAKSLLVMTGIYEATLQVEKTHVLIRKKRRDTQLQFDLLIDALGLQDGEVAAHFGVTESEPWSFQEFLDKKPGRHTLELFHEDKAFHDGVDGGLRRIASAGAGSFKERTAAEFLIAYEKACYTLRELKRAERNLLGLDPKTGEFSFKLFLSPVRTVVVALRHVYRASVTENSAADFEIARWVDKRTKQLDEMRTIFSDLQAVEFDWREIRDSDDKEVLDRNWDLQWSCPQYRRFWQQLQQESHNELQAELAAARRDAEKGSWYEKIVMREKLELAADWSPSPAFLGRANYQDANDQVQLCNYPAALNSLLIANELDPGVISTKKINEMEDLFAWWETGAKVGKLATEIGDQLVWYLLTQGLMNKIVGPYRAALATRLGVPLPDPAKLNFATQFGNVLKGYVNPLRNIVSYETFRQQGMSAALLRFARESTYEMAEDAFREDYLVRSLQMDPEVAARLAGMLWSIGTEAIDSTARITSRAAVWRVKNSPVYQRLANSSEALHVEAWKMWRDRHKTTDDPEKAVGDESKQKLWENARPKVKKERLNAIRDELQALNKKIRKGEVKPDDVRARRYALAVEAAIISGKVTSAKLVKYLSKMGFDNESAQKLLETEQPVDQAAWKKRVDESVEFVAALHHHLADIKSQLKAKGDAEGLTTFLKQLDTARQVIHRESFNYMARLLKDAGGDDEIIKALKSDPEHPITDVSPQRVRELFNMILAIVPTGSAGYLSRKGGEGEYKPYESDLDFTVLMKLEGQNVTGRERQCIEVLLKYSLQTVGKDPKLPDKFDVAYMADDVRKFAGMALDRQGPGVVMKKINDVQKSRTMTEAQKAVELAKLRKELNDAWETTLTDLPHGERYRTAGRLRMLWYLTSLGDHFLVFENGQLVRKNKSSEAEIAKLSPELQAIGKAKKAALEEWMGWEIILDDLYFAGKKAKGKAAHLDPLGEKPSAGLIKEIGKRNIRELVGAMCGDETMLKAINELLGWPAKGQYADHQTFCKQAAELIESGKVKTDPPLGDLVQLIRLMGEYKNNPDPDMLVRRMTGKDAPTAEDAMKVLTKIMQLHTAMASRLAGTAHRGIVKHMGPTFAERTGAQKAVADAEAEVASIKKRLAGLAGDEAARARTQLEQAQTRLANAKVALDAKEIFIRNKLVTGLASFKYYGGWMPEKFRSGIANQKQVELLASFRRAGATQAEIESVFERLKLKDKYADLIDYVYQKPLPPVRVRDQWLSNPHGPVEEREEEDKPAPATPRPPNTSSVPRRWLDTDDLRIWLPEVLRRTTPAPMRLAA